MKKPSNLKTKDNVNKKRIRGVTSDFENRRAQYLKLKELRQTLKVRKDKKLEEVRIFLIKDKKRKKTNK